MFCLYISFLRTHSSVQKTFSFTQILLLAYRRHRCGYFLALASFGNVNICWRSDQTSNFIHYPIMKNVIPLKISIFLFLKLLTYSCSHVRRQPHDNWPKWQGLSTTATMTTPYFMSVQALNKNQSKHRSAIPNFISKIQFWVFGSKLFNVAFV